MGATWADFRLSGAPLRPSSGQVDLTWSHLGTHLGCPGLIVMPAWVLLGQSNGQLATYWGTLEMSRVNLGSTWSLLEPIWDQFGRTWCHFTSSWDDFGTSLATEGIKIIVFHKCCVVFVYRPSCSGAGNLRELRRIYDPLGAYLGSLCAVLGPTSSMLGSTCADLWPSWQQLGPSWDHAGANLVQHGTL